MKVLYFFISLITSFISAFFVDAIIPLPNHLYSVVIYHDLCWYSIFFLCMSFLLDLLILGLPSKKILPILATPMFFVFIIEALTQPSLDCTARALCYVCGFAIGYAPQFIFKQKHFTSYFKFFKSELD